MGFIDGERKFDRESRLLLAHCEEKKTNKETCAFSYLCSPVVLKRSWFFLPVLMNFFTNFLFSGMGTIS